MGFVADPGVSTRFSFDYLCLFVPLRTVVDLEGESNPNKKTRKVEIQPACTLNVKDKGRVLAVLNPKFHEFGVFPSMLLIETKTNEQPTFRGILNKELDLSQIEYGVRLYLLA